MIWKSARNDYRHLSAMQRRKTILVHWLNQFLAYRKQKCDFGQLKQEFLNHIQPNYLFYKESCQNELQSQTFNWKLIKLLQFKTKKQKMSELVEDINPLDISFSDQKGFQPSTPSQGSPSLSDKQSISKVRTPREVFDPEITKQTKKIVFVPKTYTAQTARNSTKSYLSSTKKDIKSDMSLNYSQMYQTRYSSTTHRKQYSGALEPSPFYKSTLYESELLKQKKRAQILRWDRIESSHLKQISRLNNLINRVSTHMTAFNRLYPLKRK